MLPEPTEIKRRRMGCVHSKPNKRRGLFHQQEEILHSGNKDNSNNNKICKQSSPSAFESTEPAQTKSRHSPPVSQRRRTSSPNLPLEGLAGISEVWSNPDKWKQFKEWLRTQSEGEDSEGRALLLDRYATWLELYSQLDSAERGGHGDERVADITREILEHREGFLDRERCLRCWDGGMRSGVLRKTREGLVGLEVLLPLYPRIVDWLAEKLGSYQNYLLALNSR